MVSITGCGSGSGADGNNVGVALSEDGKRFDAYEPAEGATHNSAISGNLGVKNGKKEYQPAGFVGFGFFGQIGSTFHRKAGSSNQTAPFRFLAATMYHSLFASQGGELVSAEKWAVNLYQGEDATNGMTLDPFTVCQKVAEESSKILKGSEASNIFDNILSALQSIVAGVLVIFWAMQFMQQIIQERFTMESFLKGMCQLIIGLIIVTNAQNIAGAFVNGANDVVGKLSNSPTKSEALNAFKLFCWEKSNDNVLYIGFFASGFGSAWFASPIFWVDIGSLIGVVIMILPFIGQLICAYQIITQMVTRMLELIVRVAVAPLPLAFGAAQGFGPSSLSFLKGTFATAMQPVLIMIGALSYGAIVDLIVAALTVEPGDLGSLLGSLIMFVSYMVLSGFIGQTRQLSQEIIAR